MASAIAFIINYSCYFSEIYRGGIQSVPIGQHEAGLVLGMTRSQIFFKVTLLQMIKRIVPPMSNEIITLVKDTSLARIISLQEIIWAGRFPTSRLRPGLAAVFHRRILSDLQRAAHPVLRLAGEETRLFPRVRREPLCLFLK